MPGRHSGIRDSAGVAVFAALLPIVSILLRVAGYKRTRAWLERLVRASGKSTPVTAEWIDHGHHLAHLARRGARWTPANTSCLRQALLVHVLLRRQGLPSDIMFGVDAHQGTMDMHAWVELAGHPLGQPGLRHRPFEKAR